MQSFYSEQYCHVRAWITWCTSIAFFEARKIATFIFASILAVSMNIFFLFACWRFRQFPKTISPNVLHPQSRRVLALVSLWFNTFLPHVVYLMPFVKATLFYFRGTWGCFGTEIASRCSQPRRALESSKCRFYDASIWRWNNVLILWNTIYLIIYLCIQKQQKLRTKQV